MSPGLLESRMKIGVDTQSCIDAVERMRGARVLVIGDVMLDHYVFGKVDRISPEAPVPVVLAQEEKYILGGAGNVAQNIKSLGGECRLVCVNGDDPEGEVLFEKVDNAGIDAKIFMVKDRPTTKKTRVIAANQQVVRVDKEAQGPIPDELADKILMDVSNCLDSYTIVILSDYGKGVITDYFVSKLVNLVRNQSKKIMILVDPKTVNYSIYKGVDLLTPNTKEAGEGAHMQISTSEDILEAGVRLFKRLNPKHLLITTGPDGMVLFESQHEAWRIPTFAKKVYDVTGAGDTVIASLGLSLAAGCDLKLGCVLANHAAGLAVAQVGSVAVMREDLAAVVQSPSAKMTRLM